MRIRNRAFLQSTLLLSLVAGPLLPELSAGIISYSFSGRIIEVSQAATDATKVVVGNTITGAFAYDPTQAGSAGNFTFTGSSKIHTMTFKIFDSAGTQVFTDSYSGNATAYYFNKVAFSSTTGTTLDIKGDTVYKQGLGVTGPGPPPAFDLALFNPTNAGGFSATNLPLPTSTTITNFVKTTGTLDWDPSGQSFGADITSFNDQTVPEPTSLVMAVLAILTCTAGCLISRRKPAGDLQRGRYAPPPHP
jgi:hypothetical protein